MMYFIANKYMHIIVLFQRNTQIKRELCVGPYAQICATNLKLYLQLYVRNIHTHGCWKRLSFSFLKCIMYLISNKYMHISITDICWPIQRNLLQIWNCIYNYMYAICILTVTGKYCPFIFLNDVFHS